MASADQAKFSVMERALRETQSKVDAFVAQNKKTMSAAQSQHAAQMTDISGTWMRARGCCTDAWSRQEQQVPSPVRRAGEGGEVAVQRCVLSAECDYGDCGVFGADSTSITSANMR